MRGLDEFWPLAVGSLTSVVMVPLCRRVAYRVGIVALANPDVRTHTGAVPLLGGVAILAGAVPALVAACAMDRRFLGLVVALSSLLPLGIYKDKVARAVHPAWQLVLQVISVLLLAIFGGHLAVTGSMAVDLGLSVFVGVWVINGINFIDVMDGLASALGVVGAAFFAVISIGVEDRVSAVLALGLCGGCLGFFLFNRPPAKIFMGDVGSFTIGLTFVALIFLAGEGRVHPVTKVSLLLVPLADVVATSVIRIVRARNPTVGGKEHIPLILLNAGWNPWSVLVLMLSLAVGSGAIAWIL